MYSCSTLHFKYFRCYGPRKYILSSDPNYEMVGKNTAVQSIIMTPQCKMTSLCRSQCKNLMMSLCAVSSRELKKRVEMGRFIL